MGNHHISAEDINHLFYDKPNKKPGFPLRQLLGSSLLTVVGIFFAVNGPAIVKQVGYWWQSDIQIARQSNQLTSVIEKSLPAVAKSEAISPSDTTTDRLSQLPNNSIWIPKINTKAPIIWDVGGNDNVNNNLLKALENGVARYPKTALPNQIGNVFITGHSSNYWWEKGQYKTIFALLDKLVVGDLIYIKYQGILYTYRVNGQKIVKPTETSVLKPTQTPILSLMTCTPTGTALLRRIVTADLISPTENLVVQPTSPSGASLQAVR